MHFWNRLFPRKARPAAPAPPPVADRMRNDWDARAREDARFFIATGAAASEETFRASGAAELEGAVLDGIVLDPAARVLEIGCGVGRLLRPLAQRVAAAHGVDISPAMVEQARAACADCPNLRFSVTDGTLRGFAASSLDLVFSWIVFQHIPEKGPIETYVKEAARVLRPGGLVRFQVDGRWRLEREGPETYDGVKLRPEEVREIVRRAGLKMVEEWGEETHYHSVTAARAGSGAAVRLLPRAWDATLLERLLSDLGFPDAPLRAGKVVSGAASLRSALEDLESRWEGVANEEFVRRLHLALLGSEPEEWQLRQDVRLLDAHLETRGALVDTLVAGATFRNLLRPIDSGVPWYRRETAGDATDRPLHDLVDELERGGGGRTRRSTASWRTRSRASWDAPPIRPDASTTWVGSARAGTREDGSCASCSRRPTPCLSRRRRSPGRSGRSEATRRVPSPAASRSRESAPSPGASSWRPRGCQRRSWSSRATGASSGGSRTPTGWRSSPGSSPGES